MLPVVSWYEDKTLSIELDCVLILVEGNTTETTSVELQTDNKSDKKLLAILGALCLTRINYFALSQCVVVFVDYVRAGVMLQCVKETR